METVWVCEEWGVEHGRLVMICATEDIARKWLKEQAISVGRDQKDTREDILNDKSIVPPSRREEWAEGYEIEWLDDNTFTSNGGWDHYGIREVEVYEV